MAERGCMRRGPLEEGRDGLVEGHGAVFILARVSIFIDKWLQRAGLISIRQMSCWISIPNRRSEADEEEPSPVGHQKEHGPSRKAKVIPKDQATRAQDCESCEHEQGDRQTDDPENALHA